MNPNSPYQNQARARQQPMTQYQIIDEQHGGLVVSTFAHPSEWRAASKVMWNMQHTNQPALVYAIAFNPQGVESFEFLPMQAFDWMEGDDMRRPIGTSLHGLMRMPPRPAPNALVELVIPQFRGDRRNLRVVGAHPVQNLWQATNDPPPQTQAEGVVARIEYDEQGRTIEEEFYGGCQWVPATLGALNWGFAPLFCFRAERGQLDSMRPTFWQIAGSLQRDPRWSQLYQQIAQQLMSNVIAENEAIVRQIYRDSELAGQRLAYNEKLRNERAAQLEASIEWQRQQNLERSRDQYTAKDALGDALLGRTAYRDPNSAAGNYHYESDSASYVWTNNQGEFYPTNNPTDDPNLNRDGNWVRATPVRPS